jgi:transcriptional regulator with XRE-family HTH domain
MHTPPRYAVLGRLLAHHRSHRSQESVADILGISRTTLSHAERGYILLSGTTLAKLLHLYDTDGVAPPPSRSDKVTIYDAIVDCGEAHAL